MVDSRAPSVADHHDPLSDGYLSDSAMDRGKEKKKRKTWKVCKVFMHISVEVRVRSTRDVRVLV